MTVSGQVEFDAYGRMVKQYYPVTEPKGAGNAVFNPAFDDSVPRATEMAYDALDRNTSTRLPDLATTTMAYGFGADRDGALRFRTTVTDANGKVKESYRDIRQLITAVKETSAGATLWTSYAYDPLKQITRVIDAKGNTTTVAYDQLGRRTAIDNPDTGKTETVYDLASNPIRKITAVLRLKSEGAVAGRFQNLGYTYDAVGNITDLANDVAIPPASSMGGPTASHFGYDDLYRLTHADGNFKSSPNKAQAYTLDLQYDAIHNIVGKIQNDAIASNGGKPVPQKATTYNWAYAYAYAGAQPHAPSHIGDRSFFYDANDNKRELVAVQANLGLPRLSEAAGATTRRAGRTTRTAPAAASSGTRRTASRRSSTTGARRASSTTTKASGSSRSASRARRST